MNHQEKTEFERLCDDLFPSDEEIEAMSSDEVREQLKEDGVNVEELEQRIAAQKEKHANMLLFALARKRSKQNSLIEDDRPHINTPATKEEILKQLHEHYGDNLPMAARNFSDMNIEEARALYADLMEDE